MPDGAVGGIESRASRACAVTCPENNVSKKVAWDGLSPLILAKGWALSADDLQWIVLRARRYRGSIKWQPVAFVRSTRAVLRRVLQEKGITLGAEGESALNALNPTFREWRDAVRNRSRDAGEK